MTGPWLYALAVGPLGFYLWVLAVWQSDRRPRVVSGLVDYGLLVFGVGGIVAFGPFGQMLARAIFGRPAVWEWGVLGCLMALCAASLARRALRRVVVYHVDREALSMALDEILRELDGRFTPTLDGYEDRAHSRLLRVEFTRIFRCALIEARGERAEKLIEEIRLRLRRQLQSVTTGPSAVSLFLYGCSILVMVIPLVGLFLSQPKAREALRVLLERFKGV
jgi:hypothetical protein